ncbi:MAG: hypothetical protein SCALA702_23940 [Melioribacteraceae bacterium]|nr:MAG: hypothetical protein SCALA702_23940 [Melioribacteraceae bacterium]
MLSTLTRMLVKLLPLIIVSFLLIPTNNISAQAQQGDGFLAFAEKMPEPVGGLKEVYKNIVYPDIAKKAGVQGKVFALAYVNEKGEVDDVKILKGIGAGCDEAAIDGIKKAKFSPGQNKGQNVKVKLSLTINFKL